MSVTGSQGLNCYNIKFESKNPIAKDDFQWIFAVTGQLA